MKWERGILLLAALSALVGAGCDDVSPLAYVRPSHDAALADHVDLTQVDACRSCATVEGATCRPAYDGCQAQDSRCAKLLDCLTGADCWRQLDVKNFTDPPPCAVDCLSRGGVTSINEIGGPVTAFYLCIIDPARCAPACFDPVAPVARDP